MLVPRLTTPGGRRGSKGVRACLTQDRFSAMQGVEDDYIVILCTLAASISFVHSFEIIPFPVTDFGHVLAVLVDVLLMLDKLVHELVL
jgi:hypothetical protein